jgi:hypothetical protein
MLTVLIKKPMEVNFKRSVLDILTELEYWLMLSRSLLNFNGTYKNWKILYLRKEKLVSVTFSFQVMLRSWLKLLMNSSKMKISSMLVFERKSKRLYKGREIIS